MNEQSIQDRIRRVLSRATADKLTDDEVAQRVLEMGDEYDWRAVALDLLPAAVWAIRRQEARKREQRELEALVRRQKEHEEQQEREAREHGFDSYEAWQTEIKETKRKESADFHARENGYEDAAHMWREIERQNVERYARRREETRRRMEEALAPIRAALEFTEAFLESEFATGDGRRVTWGDATADDHVKRIEWMTARIEGMEQDVDLHLRVLRVIEESGVRTLREAREGVPA